MINVDITLHKFPCSILSVDIQDVMGTHSVNVHGTLTKNKLNKYGKVIGQEVYKKANLDADQQEDSHGNDEEMPSFDLVKKEIDNEEGCQVFGFFYVKKVPGNFHISAHAYGSIVQQLIALGYFNFNVAHTVNHLSFGNNADISQIKSRFAEGQLNTLDGVIKNEHSRSVYEYYLKVSDIYFI